MTREEILANLSSPEMTIPSEACLINFVMEMRDLEYGRTETRQAFHFYAAGWNALKERVVGK